MAAPKGTAGRTLEWVDNNRGAGSHRIAKWSHEAGFSGFVQWCGVFLGSAMKAQGLQPPKGYPSAINWSSYGTKVKSIADARPGDILVYGSHHVAMYLGHGRQIQGNDEDGTVGESGVGSSLGLGPITAIRRPPYRGRGDRFINNIPTRAEREKHERVAGEEDLNEEEWVPGEGLIATRHNGGPGASIKEGATSVKEMVEGIYNLDQAIVDTLQHPESFLLTAGLLGGGAFLIYYGAALVLGVHKPVATPAAAAAGVAAKGAEL